ncbi:hypothetical protein LTR78_003425 [Recurvomyces mirabilis]|uniref:Quinate repressor protein n=1 Tax=Recurvomyces mirabilis TaxID=574656 RepID=A0AAE0WRW0_9PEZI|nr:hypothetical protein LTR78_003425 [Recurvomyces mirabilis]KAK5154541.1 hypothetical protein LTS14_006678 [Recurvomyces mirabilis]
MDNVPIRDRHASIILVGLPGAGKRSLSFIAASYLGWRWISGGLYFHRATGISEKAFLDKFGHEQFQARMLDVVRQMLLQNPQEAVIDCGYASLHEPVHDLLQGYRTTRRVVHILRCYKQISRLDDLSEEALLRMQRPDHALHQCADFTYFNLHDSTAAAVLDDTTASATPHQSFALRSAKCDIESYVDRLLGRIPVKDTGVFSMAGLSLERRARSYVITLKLSDFASSTLDLTSLELCEDAVELKIDTVSNTLLRDTARFVASLRRHMDAELIYTIDTIVMAEARFTTDQLTSLLQFGARVAVDYITVDLEMPDAVLHAMIRNKSSTRLIGHKHFAPALGGGWLDPARSQSLQQSHYASLDVLRFTQEALSRDDNEGVVNFRREARSRVGHIPVIVAYNTGHLGRTSLVTSNVLVPVSPRFFPLNVMDASITEFDLQRATAALFHTYQYDSLIYTMVGDNVLQSRTPQMHNAAYKIHGLLHSFRPLVTSSFEDALHAWYQPDFGGSAVSYPYKEIACRACLETSPHASAIGSVNTVLPLRRSAKLPQQAALVRNTAGEAAGLYGDNSDWYGVYACLREAMSPWNSANIPKATTLVFGAGGTARAAVYALLQIGYRSIFLRNRTQSNAERVAAHFNKWAYDNLGTRSEVVRYLPALQSAWPTGQSLPSVIISCIPASRLNDTTTLPSIWLSNAHGGVAVDFSYAPVDTPLLSLVRRHEATTGQPWSTVDGLQILLEQGMRQFEQMTGRRAPVKTMRHAMYAEDSPE